MPHRRGETPVPAHRAEPHSFKLVFFVALFQAKGMAALRLGGDDSQPFRKFCKIQNRLCGKQRTARQKRFRELD